MRRLALLSLVCLFGMAAPAAGTGDNGNPDCHGSNEEECRPDPQPDRGQDCEHNDDHCAGTTTTTRPATTTTTGLLDLLTTTTLAPTTTTTVAATTTTEAPTTTTLAAAVVAPPVPEVMGTSVEREEQLPKTGGAVLPALFMAAVALTAGGAALRAGRRDA